MVAPYNWCLISLSFVMWLLMFFSNQFLFISLMYFFKCFYQIKTHFCSCLIIFILNWQVTLVAFATDDKYMDCLKNGRLPKRDCATVKYSEKCNILSKKGRVQLVKTFLDMATLMQCLWILNYRTWNILELSLFLNLKAEILQKALGNTIRSSKSDVVWNIVS